MTESTERPAKRLLSLPIVATRTRCMLPGAACAYVVTEGPPRCRLFGTWLASAPDGYPLRLASCRRAEVVD